jgi:hypothetical protein
MSSEMTKGFKGFKFVEIDDASIDEWTDKFTYHTYKRFVCQPFCILHITNERIPWYKVFSNSWYLFIWSRNSTLLWKRKVQLSVHKFLPLDPILSRLNTILSQLNTILSRLNTILSQLNTILSRLDPILSRLNNLKRFALRFISISSFHIIVRLFPLKFYEQNFVWISHFPRAS